MNAAASWTAVTSGAIHRFLAGESEGPGEFQTTWFHVKSGNCAGFVTALQNLAENLAKP